MGYLSIPYIRNLKNFYIPLQITNLLFDYKQIANMDYESLIRVTIRRKKELPQKNQSSHYILTTLFSAKAPETMLYALLCTFFRTK